MERNIKKIVFFGSCLLILLIGIYLHSIELSNEKNMPQIVKFPEPRYDILKNNLFKNKGKINNNVQNKTKS